MNDEEKVLPIEELDRPCDICGQPDADLVEEMLHPDFDHALSDGLVVVCVPVPMWLCPDHTLKWGMLKAQIFNQFYAAEKMMFLEGLELSKAVMPDAGGSGPPSV